MSVKTFYSEVTLGNIKSEEDYYNLSNIARILGVPIYKMHQSSDYYQFPNIIFYGNEICGNNNRLNDPSNRKKWIDKNTYIKYCLNWEYVHI